MNRPLRRAGIALAALSVVIAGTVTEGIHYAGKSAPPVRATIGDSLAGQAGNHLPGENDAAGGSTVCDTAHETNPVDGSPMPLPYAEHLFVHVGGHSWGLYDAPTAQGCLLYILSRYGGTQVYIATTETSGAIFCNNAANTELTLATYGFPYNGPALEANPVYELHQRLLDFNAFIRTLPASYPNVHVVSWDSITQVNPSPDCVHFSDDGVAAANRVNSAGF